MATIRHHARIDRPADEVWSLVTEAGDITWMDGIDACSMEGDVRTVSTMGMEIQEQVTTNDSTLRRLQYSIVGGPMVPEHHVATIDVIGDGDEGERCLLVYSCDVRPDDLGSLFDGVYASATQAIAARFAS